MVKLLQKVIPLFYALLFVQALLEPVFALSHKVVTRNKYEHKNAIHNTNSTNFQNKKDLLSIRRSQNTDPSITPAGSLTLCPGANVTLKIIDAPANPVITWSKDGDVVPGQLGLSYTVSSAGIYSATINGTPTAPVTVTSSPKPTARFTVTGAGQCGSSPVTFNNQSTGDNLTYSWDFGDPNSGANNASTGSNPTHNFVGNPGPATQSFLVKLTVTTAAGCADVFTQTVTMLQKPSAVLDGADLTTYLGEQYFTKCTPSASSITFTNTSVTTATNKKYVIQWGDGSADYESATFASPVTHPYNLGLYTLKLTVTGQNDCTETAIYHVFVGSNPSIGISNPGNTSICTGETLTFPITNTGTNPPGTKYTITFNDGTAPVIYGDDLPASVTHTFNKGSCGTSSANGSTVFNNSFSAAIEATNPCGTSAASAVPIYVSQKPVASFTTSAAITCVSNTVNLNNTSVSGSNVSTSGICSQAKSVWTISPATGYALTSGTLGSEGLSYNSWNSGSANVGIRFTTPGTYTIQLKVYSGNAVCGTDVITKTICVNPAPTAAINTDVNQGCAPLSVKATGTSSGATCGTNTFQWSVNPSTGFTYLNGTSSSSPNPEFSFTSSGSYTISLTTSSPGGSCSATATKVITVGSKPTVILTASGNICEGGTLQPRAVVTGSGIPSYQWTFEGGSPSTSTAAIPGTIIYPTAGSYTTTLTVTNDCGSTTQTNIVTVKPTPVITAVGDQNYCNGITTPVLTPATNVSGTVISWTNNNTTIGLAASGTGNIPAFITRNSTQSPLSATITINAVSNGCPATPLSFKITVNPKPNSPVTPSGPSYCTGDASTTLNATPATGNPLNWYDNAQLMNKLPSAPVPSTQNAGTFKYYVTQTNIYGCESTPSEITVTVNPAMANNVISGTQTICYNTQPNTLSQVGTLTGGTGTYSHQWQSSSDGSTWSNISGATAAGYTPGKLTSTTQYRRVSASGGCSSTSNVIIVTVQGSLTHYDIAINQSLCTGSTPALLIGEVPAGGNGTYTYRWESSLNTLTWSAVSNATGVDLQPGPLAATTYFRRITQSGDCSGMSNTVTMTIVQPPAVNAVTAKVLCHDVTTAAINFSSSSAGNITYNWTNDNTLIGLSVSGTGNIASFLARNTLHKPITANVAVTATNNSGTASCPGDPTTFTITVLPNVSLQSIPAVSVCAGSTINATVPVADAEVFAGSNVSYKWTVSNPTVGLSSGSGNFIPSFTARNSGISDLVSTVTVTPVYNYAGNQCDGTPLSYTITVKPQPTVANAGPDAKVCGAEYSLSGNTPQVGVGSWTQTNGFGALFTNAGSPDTKVSNLARGSRYVFTWSITNQDCLTSTDAVQLDVLADITNSIKASGTAICPGETVTLLTNELKGGDIPALVAASYTYSWESSADGVTGWQVMPGRNTETINVTPSAKGFYRRKVSSYQLCDVTSNVISISLNATPIQASAGNNATICDQTSYTLQGNDPGAGFTGTWTVTSGPGTITFSPDANTYNAVVNGLQPGNSYTLKWTITNGTCGTTSASVTLTDLKPLTNTLSVTEPVICAGVASLIQGSAPIGGTGNYQYSWQSSHDNQNWTTINAQTGKDLNITLATTSYLRRIVISGTCSLESTGVLITVKPAISGNTISGQAQVCTGLSAGILTGSVPIGADGNFSYQWQSSLDGTVWTDIAQASQADYPTPVLTQTTYYRRIVRSALCEGAQQSISNLFQIVVNPDALAEYTASTLSGCAPFNLKAVITPVVHADRNATYEWFANGISIGTGSAFPAYSIANDGETVIVRLVTTSKFGCTTSTKELTFSTIKAVAASFTKSITKGCGPLAVQVTNTSQPLNGGSYRWDFGNGQTSAAAQPGTVIFQPHPLNRDTTYVITLKASTSCGESIYKDSVTVRPQPKAIFTPDKTIGCSPFEINITNQSRGVPNTYTFDFGNGDKVVKTDNSPLKYTYITTKTDTLTLKMVAENECGKDSLSYRIVVYPNSVQANLVVNGDNQFGCAPVTVKFDNNSVGANNFVWTFGDGNTATTSMAPETMSHTFTQPGVYRIKLVASNGCSTASTTQTITVYDQPVAAFAINKSQFCIKEAAVFTNSNVQSGYTYLWAFGDGTTSNATQPKHSYLIAGHYTVTLTISQSFANGSVCKGAVSHELDVLSSPVSAFTSNAGPLNCAPFTLITHTTPANASSVEWNFGDTGSSDDAGVGYSLSHTYQKSGVYKVRLIAYNQNGCADTTFQTVRVTETPLAAFTPGDSVLCGASSTITFHNATTYGGSDLVTYKWLVNNNTVSTQKNLTYTFTPPASATFPYTYTIKLIAYSTIGCPDTISHSIQMHALPKAAFSVTSMASCAPFQVQLNNTSTYANTYRWYLNNTLVSIDKTPTQIVLQQPASTYKLKLVVSNQYGCQSDSLERTLSTFPKPTARFVLQDSISCNGKLDVKITNLSAGATSYTWNFGDNSPEVTATTPTHIYGMAGIYNLRLVAFNGFCRDTVIHVIRIAATPQAAFTAGTLKGCSQLTTIFQNVSAHATAYMWDFGDGTYSTSKNPTHTFTYVKSPFTVKLIAIGEYGCADTTVLNNYISVSAPPKAAFITLPDSAIRIPDYTFNFSSKSTGNPVKYKWDFGDGKTADIANPVHTYADTGIYKVKLLVTNADGCTDFIIHQVKVAGVPGYLYVPNAFEPASNRTELKTFTVRASGLSEYSLKIFNKWGELIWETSKLDMDGIPTQAWDGTMHGQPAPQGVYVWMISAKFINGTEWRGMKYPTGSTTKTGPVHLIR